MNDSFSTLSSSTGFALPGPRSNRPVVLVFEHEGDGGAASFTLLLGCNLRALHRARTVQELAGALARGPADVVVAVLRDNPQSLALLRACKATRPDVPVVFVTHRPTLDEAVLLFTEGAFDYVAVHELGRLGASISRAFHHASSAAERRRAELDRARLHRESLEETRRRDAFLARISRELRTPVTAMLGWATMLRAHRLDEDGRERAFQSIERHALVMADLVDELLDVSRMINGHLRLETHEVEVVPVLAAAVEAQRTLAEARDVALGSTLEPGAYTVTADPDRLHQIFRRLVANAIHATSPCGRIEVRLWHKHQQVEVTISSTSGDAFVPSSRKPFGPFPPEPGDSGVEHALGLGLGLVIVRHLVEAHGGRVTTEVGDNGGGFRVVLPVARCEPGTPARIQFSRG